MKTNKIEEVPTKKERVMDVVTMVIIILLLILVKKFVFTNVMVHGPSMLDTLHDKDIMVLNILGPKLNGYKRFDIVVIKTTDTKIIKRIIGLPGEEVEYKNNKLYINGKQIKDKYGTYPTGDTKKVKLGKDEYYVLGDNRTNSTDSRVLGPIKKKDIMGKTSLTIFPFNRIGFKK